MARPTQNFVGTTSFGTTNPLLHGTKWGGAFGTGVVLDYSFPTANSVFKNPYGSHNEPFRSFIPFTAAEQDAAFRALGSWDAVANVDFVKNYDNASAVGEIRFARSSVAGGGGHGYLPSNDPSAGDIWMKEGHWHTANHNAAILPGSYDFFALLHEIGHTLGLKHTFDGGYVLPKHLDSYSFSVMSYTPKPGIDIGPSHYPSTPMYYDLLAIQAMYGREPHNTENNIYTFDGNKRYWLTLDDSAGDDIIVHDGNTQAVINLNDGQWSTLGVPISFGPNYKQAETVMIGPGTVIERAYGGSANDTLIGNGVGNILDGRGGNDVLVGNDGRDTLRGNTGTDHLYGGRHQDFFDFNLWSESRAGAARDVIFDFNRAERDIIDLRDIDANARTTSVNEAFTFIGAQGFHGFAGELRVSGGIVQADLNGDRSADFEVKINLASLTINDFYL